MGALKKGQFKKQNKKMNPCKNKTHKKYKKKFKSEDILPTTDKVVMIKKNYNQGLLHHLSDQEKTENRKKESNFPGFLCLFFSFSSNPKKKICKPNAPPIRRLA